MSRILFVGAAALVALGAAAVPAVAGISGNPSFSHKLPVHVPSQAQLATFDDHGVHVGATTYGSGATSATTRSTRPTITATAVPGVTTEPGDDKGAPRTSPAAGAASEPTAEPGDDHGGLRTSPAAGPTTEPTAEPGDDHGGRSGSGH